MKKNGLVLTYVGRSNQIFKISEKGLASPYMPKYIPHFENFKCDFSLQRYGKPDFQDY